MTPDAFYANAERIFSAHGGNPDACASRAIAHACYYGAYHLVARTLNLNPTDWNTANHSKVAEAVRNYRGLNAVILAAKPNYDAMYSMRVSADYHLRSTVSALQAKQALIRAKRIFQAAGITPATV